MERPFNYMIHSKGADRLFDLDENGAPVWKELAAMTELTFRHCVSILREGFEVLVRTAPMASVEPGDSANRGLVIKTPQETATRSKRVAATALEKLEARKMAGREAVLKRFSMQFPKGDPEEFVRLADGFGNLKSQQAVVDALGKRGYKTSDSRRSILTRSFPYGAGLLELTNRSVRRDVLAVREALDAVRPGWKDEPDMPRRP